MVIRIFRPLFFWDLPFKKENLSFLWECRYGERNRKKEQSLDGFILDLLKVTISILGFFFLKLENLLNIFM